MHILKVDYMTRYKIWWIEDDRYFNAGFVKGIDSARKVACVIAISSYYRAIKYYIKPIVYTTVYIQTESHTNSPPVYGKVVYDSHSDRFTYISSSGVRRYINTKKGTLLR